MKKRFFPLLAISCMIGLTACGNSQTESNSLQTDTTTQADAAEESSVEETQESSNDSETAPEPLEDTSSDTVVIYFSATGTTKGVAEKVAAVTNADLFEIIPAEPYSDTDLDWNDQNSRTTIEMNDPDARPAIADDTIHLEDYSTAYIGYPIWWGDAPRIMSTFVETHDFSGLTVIPFCTSGSSSIGESGNNLAEQAGSGDWLSGSRLDANISEDEIKTWINDLHE